ncbi:hypothetical protein D3C81_2210040 [compost metagenome]
MLSWINDGSHSISEDLYVESNIDLVARYLSVFKSIFEKKNHIAHYKMMMKDFDIDNQDTVTVRAVEEISTGLREVAGGTE